MNQKEKITKQILVVAATSLELYSVFPELEKEFVEIKELTNFFKKNDTEKLRDIKELTGAFYIKKDSVYYAVLGLGLAQTAMNLTYLLNEISVDLILNIGICGLYPNFVDQYKIGDVVRVVSSAWGDLGAEEADGGFLSGEDLGWNTFTREDESLYNDSVVQTINLLAQITKREKENSNNSQLQFDLEKTFKKNVGGVSVNNTCGTLKTATYRATKFNAEIEDMEGASIFMVAKKFNIATIQIRSISNIASTRDKSQWNIPLALKNLKKVFL